MDDKHRKNLLLVKEMLENNNKDFKKIQKVLFDLFDKKDYNIDECKTLIRLLAENQRPLCEFRNYYYNMKKKYDNEQWKAKEKEKEDKDGCKIHDVEKEQKEDSENNKKEERNKMKDSSESKLSSKKEEIIINLEELKAFEDLFKKMKEFPNNLKDKNHPVIIKFINDWLTGFVKKSNFNNNENYDFHKNKKEKIDDKTKELKIYNSICDFYDNNKLDNYNLNKLFEKLKIISFDYIDEKQKNKLLSICICIFHKLNEKRKKIIKDKYSELIKDDEISKILFLDFKNIFLDENDFLIFLSQNVEEVSKNRNKKMREITKFNEKNISEKLLEIYNEFIYYKNKTNSYIFLNKDNIEEKFYFFFIINIITYKEVFNTGEKFFDFLYIKYYYESKDFHKLIEKKESLKKEISVYSQEDLKMEEKKEKILQDEDIDEPEEEENSMENIYSIDKFLMNNMTKFIPEKHFKIYIEVLKKISNFYKIPFPINTLVNIDNINFTFNIIDLEIFYENYRKKDITEKQRVNKYIKNLKMLEKDIFNIYKKSTQDYINILKDDQSEKLVGYRVNKNMSNTFNILKNRLNEDLKDFRKDFEIEYIPFGSVTQLLSGENGDIDLFLKIVPIRSKYKKYTQDNEAIIKKKTQLLLRLKKSLTFIDNNIVFHQTNRLCLFTITLNKIKIDINLYGINSFFAEILFREYSLMDFRFPMLVIYIKHILSVKKIKNSENQKSYINSFAWTNILLAFLQDILDPPLFPRLLNEENKRNIEIKVGGGKGKGETKILADEIPCQNTKKFDVFDYPNNNLEEIKNKFYGTNQKGENNKGLKGKNQMTASEIFLKFAQFIGYYFSYRYTIVNSCYEYQSFMPKVLKRKLKDKNTQYFFKKCDEDDDLLLIREPFDYTYNPCKTVPKENLEEIKKIFRDIYINILEKGTI